MPCAMMYCWEAKVRRRAMSPHDMTQTQGLTLLYVVIPTVATTHAFARVSAVTPTHRPEDATTSSNTI